MSAPKHPHAFIRGACAAVFAGLSLGVRAGDIAGRAYDVNTGSFLPGVAIEVEGRAISAITDSDGSFRLANVPAGTHRLRANYLGYEPTIANVSVPTTGDVTMDLNVGGEVQRLAAFTVEGYREGYARALQQKRTADNVMDIISADSVGNLPDRNVADALSRIAGVSVIADNGEGRFVSIRGADPNLNAVTLNGATLAAPGVDGRSGRAMPLDVIGSSQISQLEVVKTLTPDMDGTGIGGAINIKSSSAFERKERYLSGSLGAGYSDLARDQIYEGDITFTDRFGPQRTFGVALSASYSRRPFRTEAIQSTWGVQTIAGTPTIVPNSLEILPEDAVRDRLGFNANLEYRPSDSTQVYLRSIYNRFEEENFRQEVVNEQNGGASLVSPTVVRWANARAERRVFWNRSKQTLMNFTAGGSHRFGPLTILPELTYSYAQERQPERFQTGQFRGGNTVAGPMTLDFSTFRYGFATGSSIYLNPAQYPNRRFSFERSSVEETTWTPRVDLKWNVDELLGGRGELKAGAKLNQRERYVHDRSDRYTGPGSLTIATTGAARATGQSVLGYNTGFDIDYATLRNWVNTNLGSLNYDAVGSNENNVEDTYDTEEEIGSLYGMATVRYGNLTVLGGARYEHTDAEIRGYEYRTRGNTFIGVFPNRGSFTYDNIMPNVQARFAVRDNLVVRAAYTSTIGRPRYENAAPKSTLAYAPDLVDPNPAFPFNGTLTIGNPRLKPYEAQNYDFAVEYYHRSGGIVSVAAFHKDVDNPIYRFTQDLRGVSHNGLAFDELRTSEFRNAESGKITGLELAVQLPLKFLPRAFQGFGIDANYTRISSEVHVQNRTDDLPFFEQPDDAANLSLYYQEGRIQARVAWNYQSASLRELRPLFGSGLNLPADYYRSDRYSIDAQASYKITENFRVFLNGQNLTNQPQDTYTGEQNRLRYSREFGYNIRGGVRFRF
ncbi:MAG: TonB-dependent receptor [Opitutaceae bacterium]|nr:TonB-dependent receptor [Opitutaceae bacterium]